MKEQICSAFNLRQYFVDIGLILLCVFSLCRRTCTSHIGITVTVCRPIVDLNKYN